MKIKEFRTYKDIELQQKLEDFKKQLMELEFKRYTSVEKPHLFKEIKKNIARILTILNERAKKHK